MANKSTKKPVAKTATKSVKAATKPATKKVAAKKSAPKSANASAKEVKAVAPVMDVHTCGCGAECKCGSNCKCGANCGCGANCKCGGGKFGRVVAKLVMALIIFILGFCAAKMCCCHKPNMRMMRPSFINGCLSTETVKCPKMLESLPAMDANNDGCISKDEYKAVRKEMKRQARATRKARGQKKGAPRNVRPEQASVAE